jgi:hypothetical protein
MKHEWKKAEKNLYQPKNQQQIIDIHELKFFTVSGQGNPNDENFRRYIEILYSLSYVVKMSPKKGIEPVGYFDYTVYPLEGVWDLTEQGKQKYNGIIDKNELVFNLMIRQPDFVTEDFAKKAIEIARKKNPNELFDKVKFERITEGYCVQILHNGSYDSEPESFAKMDEYCIKNNYKRIAKTHREIYLSDARKVEPDKLKTILRYNIFK